MTKENVLLNLKKLIGQEFDAEEIIIAFGSFKESGETEVYVGKSNNNGYDYIAYINAERSTQFLFVVNNEIIEDVWIA